MNPTIPHPIRRVDVDEDWSDLAAEFMVRKGTTYLNHGSFGISPRAVREARRAWIEKTDSQPMNTFVREHEPAWLAAIARLADFVGTAPENLVFADNATFAMNIVADSFPLASGDEVLSNNHEYGAVHRIWTRACQRRNARLVIAPLPVRFESREQVVEAVFAAANERTRLLIISHVTSPTALIMPIEAIVAEARRRGISVCVDGPHAPAHIPLNIDALQCDFYTASCHKWLAAPLGTGFLFAHPRWQPHVEPQQMSWGRLLPNMPERWFEQFIWPGTRDFSGYLSVPVAVEFMESVGLESFQARVRGLQAETTRQLTALTGKKPIGADLELWYGSMAHVPLPDGDWSQLQQWLWDAHRIEVPIINFDGNWYVRVSHHLYTTRHQVDQLIAALRSRFC
jgi:isopenicillin-N epimerase